MKPCAGRMARCVRLLPALHAAARTIGSSFGSLEQASVTAGFGHRSSSSHTAAKAPPRQARGCALTGQPRRVPACPTPAPRAVPARPGPAAPRGRAPG